MSKSRARTKSTKAGVALTAEARRKLHELADWIERQDLLGQDNPRIKLGTAYCVMTNHEDVTQVSPVGALIQMFLPFTKADARRPTWGLWVIDYEKAFDRAAAILDISRGEFQLLVRYWYREGSSYRAQVKQLRSLK